MSSCDTKAHVQYHQDEHIVQIFTRYDSNLFHELALRFSKWVIDRIVYKDTVFNVLQLERYANLCLSVPNRSKCTNEPFVPFDKTCESLNVINISLHVYVQNIIHFYNPFNLDFVSRFVNNNLINWRIINRIYQWNQFAMLPMLNIFEFSTVGDFKCYQNGWINSFYRDYAACLLLSLEWYSTWSLYGWY